MMDHYRTPPDDDCGCDPHPDPKHDPHCPPCEPPPACELECLIRPEFYCGQELTEDDLNSLVRWTDRRLARTRYRDGWGVVCGLEVCIDPRCPTRVKVSPGYAVNCCGDDLVLCETTCIDLSDCCPDPCHPDGYDPDAAAKQDREFAEVMAKRLGIRQLPFRLRKCKPVDICLQADDCPVVSVPHPGTNCDCGCKSGSRDTCGCGPKVQAHDDPCAVMRRKETAKLVLCEPRDHAEPAREFQHDWEAAGRVEEEILKELKGQEKDPKAILDALARLKFCTIGIADRILEVIANEGIDDLDSAYRGIRLGHLLFWYMIDRRLRLRERYCHDCKDDKVCIARAWLFTGSDQYGKKLCFIGWLDTADPVRRRLSPVRLPAPAGSVNLVETAMGRDPRDAALALSAAGIEVADIKELSGVPETEFVAQILRAPPFVAWSQRVTLAAALTCHGPRVIGWHVSHKAVVGTPISTDEPSQPTIGEKRWVDPVVKLDRIGNARADALGEAGIATVGDLIEFDHEQLVEIAKGWSNLGRDMTPERFATWLIEHAKAYVKGDT